MEMNIKKNDFSGNSWRDFVTPAEDFFIGYLILINGNYSLSECPLFLLGNAIENYLKAVYSQQKDVKSAVECGHNLRKLFIECQKNDPEFLKEYNYDKIKREIEVGRGQREIIGFKGELVNIFENNEFKMFFWKS